LQDSQAGEGSRLMFVAGDSMFEGRSDTGTTR